MTEPPVNRTFFQKLLDRLLPEDEPHEQIRSYFVKGFSGMILIQGMAMVFTFVVTWLLTRLLGKDAFGAYAYLFAIVNLAGILATFGYRTLVVRETAAYRKTGRWTLIKGLRNWSLGITLATGLVGGLLVFVLYTNTYLQNHSGLTRQLVLVGCLAVPLLAQTHVLQSLLNGMQHVLLGNLPLMVIKPFILLAGIGVFYLLGRQLLLADAITLNTLAFAVAFLGAAGAFLYKTHGRLKGLQAESKRKQWITSGWYFWLLSLLTILNSQADLLILGMLRPMGDVGVYRVVLKLAEFIPLFLFLTNTVIAPVFARLYETGEIAGFQRLIYRSSKIFILATLPLLGALLLFPAILLGIFGPDFTAGREALLILAAGQGMNVLMGSVGLILSMMHRENWVLYTFLLSSSVNILLDFLLIPGLGIVGAAVANAAALTVWNLSLAFLIRKKTGLWSSIILGKIGQWAQS